MDAVVFVQARGGSGWTGLSLWIGSGHDVGGMDAIWFVKERGWCRVVVTPGCLLG